MPIILSQLRPLVEIAVFKIKKNIISSKIMKSCLIEDMTDFLQMSNKLFSKKRRQINKTKQKSNIKENNPKKLLLVI